MGTLKALLEWQGRPLIMHQIVALREAGADEVVVVLGHRADELQARIGSQPRRVFRRQRAVRRQLALC